MGPIIPENMKTW